MREFQERKRVNRIIFSWPVISLLVILDIVVAVRLFGIFKESRGALQEESAAKLELETLQAKKNQLEAEVKRLSTNEGVEGELRKRFGVSKAGEESLVIIDNNLKASTTGDAPKINKGFLRNFIDFLKSFF